MKKVKLAHILLIVLSVLSLSEAVLAASPPPQPTDGPGGAMYKHREVSSKSYGENEGQYLIYEPSDPKPVTAPIIIFNHGWGGTNPRAYGAWIEHIVRRGNIVVFPMYQEPGKFRYPTEKVTANAINAVKNAFETLKQPGHVKPELDKVALVGHSAGGNISANIAALASASGLPIPRAFMSVQPGKTWGKTDRINIELEDLSKVHASTLILTVVGDRDNTARDIDAKRIFYETTHVPLNNKDFITMVSDEHGSPALIADHFSPTARDADYDLKPENEVASPKFPKLRERLRERFSKKETSEKNQIGPLHYYGLWKLFDGLTDAAFYGKNRKYALGNTPEQRYMGRWSDGKEVKELVVTDRP